MNQTWDAEKYKDNFSFVHQYGNDVAKWIDIRDARRLLDLGCGNGALTARFAERGLSVTGIDASEEMLAVARREHPEINFLRADATDFRLDFPVDVAFSNAALHWIAADRQPEMIRCVYRALRESGQFVFEMGGYGNNRLIHETLSKSFQTRGLNYTMPFYFPTIGEYSKLLEENGFLVTRARLFDRPTPLHGEDGLADWIRMFIQKPFEEISDATREEIVHESAENLKPILWKDGAWYADYVRLRMRAIKI